MCSFFHMPIERWILSLTLLLTLGKTVYKVHNICTKTINKLKKEVIQNSTYYSGLHKYFFKQPNGGS